MGTSGERPAVSHRQARVPYRWPYWWAAALAGASLCIAAPFALAIPAGATGGPPSQVVLPPGGSSAAVESTDCDAAANCTAVGHFTDANGNQQGFVDQGSGGNWLPAQQVVPPADAAGDPVVDLSALSCPTQSTCEAVGSYHDSDLLMEGLEVHLVSGNWVASAIALPASAGAPPSSPCYGPSECPTSPASTLASVSCPAPGECAAVGRVQYPGSARALIWTETGGKWSTAFEPSIPTENTTVPTQDSLASVSCPSVGNCSAVGAFGDKEQLYGLAVDESAGTWGTGTQVQPPQGASSTTSMSLTSVSCTSGGNCSATGYYGA
ncbi:MAG TPA: hypothetical protein VFN61_11990, partial [Acidimicrobiales bacterium]|nr:hypothetical protein [Acidimicrobiales bacterium]